VKWLVVLVALVVGLGAVRLSGSSWNFDGDPE
jgi:hypothetical protein